MTIQLFLFLLLIVAPIGTIIHESGHLIGAKLMKADHIIISIGYGRKVFTFSFKNIRINICIFFFIGGYVHNKREVSYRVGEMIFIIALGPILNGIFATFFYWLSQLFPSEYLYLLFIFNLWLAFINTIPFKIKDKQSDGYMIFNLFRKNCVKL